MHDVGLDMELVTDKPQHMLASAIVLVLPGALVWGADASWRLLARALQPANLQMALQPAGGDANSQAVQVLQRAAANYEAQAANAIVVAPRKDLLELSYAFLPLVWAGTLAHYIDPLMTEAGTILPVRGCFE